MKTKIIYFLVIALALSSVSCEGFLDKEPYDSIPQKEAIRNLKDTEATLNGIYSVWNGAGLYSGYLTLLPDLQSDLAYSVVGFTNNMGSIFSWNIYPTNDYSTTVYGHLYKVISNIGFLFDNLDNIQLKEYERTAFDNLLGEAYFSRALAYTELAKYFSPAYDPATASTQPGVSIWNHFGAGKPARSTLAQTYTQILTDLQASDSLLQTTVADTGRITRGALDALYARVYLYMQDWEKAEKAATRVISDPHYRLAEGYSNEQTQPGQTEFFKMWTFDSSPEIIWKLESSPTNLGGALGSFFCASLGNILRIDYAPAVTVVNQYEANDIRRDTYFSDTVVNGSPMPIIIKYPGNPALRPSDNIVYSNNPKVFRLAEMYLIRAEAYAHLNESSKANTDLITLRTKRIKNYQHTTVSGNMLLQEIRKERVLELYMEGHRLYDLKRYGAGFTRKSQAQSISPYDQLTILPTDHRFTWPIPSHEIDANRNMTQNAGY